MEGKLDVDSLQQSLQSLLSRLGKKNEGIVVSALIGIDACAYDLSKAQQIAQDFYQTSDRGAYKQGRSHENAPDGES